MLEIGCWRSGLQAPDGLLLIGGNVAIQLQLLSIDFLQVQLWRAGGTRELDQRELPGYLLKYPEVVFCVCVFCFLVFLFCFGVVVFLELTSPKLERYIYLDIRSAATLDRLLEQLQQHFFYAYPTIHLSD